MDRTGPGTEKNDMNLRNTSPIRGAYAQANARGSELSHVCLAVSIAGSTSFKFKSYMLLWFGPWAESDQ